MSVGHGAEAVVRRPFVFGRKRVGVVLKRPSAMEGAGGVGGAGAFGVHVLASLEEFSRGGGAGEYHLPSTYAKDEGEDGEEKGEGSGESSSRCSRRGNKE